MNPNIHHIAMIYLNKDHNVGMGAGYIASTIQQQGYYLDFFDTCYTSLDRIYQILLCGDYDFILISANTLFYSQAVALAKIAKQCHSAPCVLLGGIHATILGGQILEDCPYIDYVCVGEGEGFIAEFLEYHGSLYLNDVQNLCYRDDQGIIHSNPIRPCVDLTRLPAFNWNLFYPTSIINPGPLPGFCYVFATRGCPYRCSYCCNSFWLDLYHINYLRKKRIDDVIAELQWLKDHYPVQTFYFADEMILNDVEYITELLHRVKREIQLPYGCMARVERINPEIVRLFSETGCAYVGMGIECGDEKFRRDFLNRNMTNDQIITAFKELRKIPGIKLASYNMKGYPADYDEALTKSTLTLNGIIKPDFMGMSIFYPFPGTKLYEYCVRYGWIDPDKSSSVTDYYTESVLKHGNDR